MCISTPGMLSSDCVMVFGLETKRNLADIDRRVMQLLMSGFA